MSAGLVETHSSCIACISNHQGQLTTPTIPFPTFLSAAVKHRVEQEGKDPVWNSCWIWVRGTTQMEQHTMEKLSNREVPVLGHPLQERLQPAPLTLTVGVHKNQHLS